MSTLATPESVEEWSVELAVTGMTCAACARRVERSLNKLETVTASVNFATEKVYVQAPEPVAVETLIAQVEGAGYGAGPVQRDARVDSHLDYLWRRLVLTLLVGVPLADLSFAGALSPELRFTGWQWVLLVLCLPVATWSAWPFHRAAVRAARHGTTSMDTLIALGVVVATVWSVYTIFGRAGDGTASGAWGLIFTPSGAIYFDVVVVVTTFVLAGRIIEARARRNAGAALRSLAAMTAKAARVVNPDGSERSVPPEYLHVGDRISVRAGETLAADGAVLEGAGALDTSAMTGESTPMEIAAGDSVTGGTVLLTGHLIIAVGRVGGDTQLAQLVAVVEAAQREKAAVQRLADRICSVFVPAVLTMSALTLVGWLLAGASTSDAVSTALAVLIIACPCALGLATPTAMLVASSCGARIGVFIKGHQALESARVVDTVVLDKTGTLTSGRMRVGRIHLDDGADRAETLAAAGAVEDASEHAVGAAIARYAKAEVGALPEVADFTTLAGLGVRGTVSGRSVVIGSSRLLAGEGVRIPAELDRIRGDWEAGGDTTVLAALDGTAVAVLALTDTVRPSAAAAVGQLRELGLRVVLLTGDNAATAQAVAQEVGIDEVIAEVLPVRKAEVIAELQRQGRVVAMVGDGINDAPALAGAQLGLAVGSGTDVAIGAADLVLTGPDLRAIPRAIVLARAALRTIRGNLFWAFGYNLVALPLAACGVLNPLIAGAAMALSSVFVVTNSLRLRRVTAPSGPRPAHG
ncbi:MAG TPA: heavy metal translocating P-type ATPase [Mycobacteriales bacterium]|nr:heavy metal translocating P-type ATPase [Mycobacteriales bacterium]